MDKTSTIECSPDGPYIVKSLEHLKDSNGESLATKPVMALCRCGGSATKPYCDGTHQRNGFSGAKLSDGGNDKRDNYQGKQVTIHDNRALCAHSGRCTDGLASVFKYGSEPWIDPNGAQPEAIAQAVRNCPSGALSYSVNGVERKPEAEQPSVTVTKDGPYEVVGGVHLPNQAWGEGASPDQYTLCRCGGSKNKPFCDGTHWSIGFKG